MTPCSKCHHVHLPLDICSLLVDFLAVITSFPTNLNFAGISAKFRIHF